MTGTARHSALPSPEDAALFLDFDGTLVDIADRPDGIAIPGDLARLLGDLDAALGGALAIVSGRRLDDLEAFLPDFAGIMVGGHGAERRIAGQRQTHPVAGSAALENATRIVQDAATRHPGLIAETKPTGIVLHYRQCPDREAHVREIMETLVRDVPGAELHAAKMAFELRPDDIGKDRAVAELLKKTAFARRVPVFFGDDATDEPAMRYAQENGGVACKVGDGESVAMLRLPDPHSVRDLLANWF